ncbi:MAG TPA: S49 family peptidase [Kofleriaceae bacterium]|nr:S49 family peptidase [Kofleriaceae bacterium]
MRQRFSPAGLCAIDPRSFFFFFDGPSAPENVARDDGTVIVSIRGPLEHHAGWFDSYDAITARVQAAIEARPRAIVLSIDSPGGLTAGNIDSAQEIRKLCADARVPLYAFVDGNATSAAYALACAAERIAVSPTGMVGSIGVIAEIRDARAQAEMFGVNVRVLTSGARKADGHPMVELTDAAAAALQKQINGLASVFFEHVASSRGMGVDAVAALEAAQFMGAEAVSIGLADEVKTLDAMLAAIAAGEFKAADAAGVKTMNPKSSKAYDEAIAALRKAAEGDDEEATKAKRMLKAELAEDDAPAKKDEPDGDESRKSEDGPKKDAKSEDAPPPKKDDDGDEAKAMAAKALATAEATARDVLLASRPDFSAEERATLEKASMEVVRDAVKSWPRRALPKPAAAATATGTRGEGQGDESASRLPSSEKRALDLAMGLVEQKLGVEEQGNRLVLGAMVPVKK